MKALFSLFQSHLDYAHNVWAQLVQPGDLVIDATCGNGHDTAFLASLVSSEGHVIAMDIQQTALAQTKQRVKKNINLLLQSHETFPINVKPTSCTLIVYNLGYLPGGDKKVTTQRHSTLTSVKNALPLIKQGGAISITCYPGHPEGAEEEKILLAFCHTLDPKTWAVTHLKWLNRTKSPSFLLLQKGA